MQNGVWFVNYLIFFSNSGDKGGPSEQCRLAKPHGIGVFYTVWQSEMNRGRVDAESGAEYAVSRNTPFCVTGWPIVDNQLNSTFGNRHSLQPIGGIHYWLAYQQKRLDSNWPFCITLRQ